MSLLDKASLVVTPNAYKASKLYSVVPSDGAGDMTVVRATTATRVNSLGLIESVAVNVPRIDYTNGSCPSLLVEPQRTNLLTYSNSFISGTGWSTAGSTVTITPNFGISPDGTQNSTRVQFSTSALNFFKTIISSNATASFYIKGIAGQTINFYIGSTDQLFTLNGEWQRVQKTAVSVSLISISTFNSATARDIQIYGAQLEAGSYATSYIPTVASSVTRNADLISKTGISSLIGQTDGTLFFDTKGFLNDFTNNKFITYNDSSTNNQIGFNYTATTGNIIGYFRVNSVTNTIISTINQNTNSKIILRYIGNVYTLFINGTLINNLTILSGFSSPLTTLKLSQGNDSNFFNGNINSIQVYKTALTDTECISLTTL